MRSPNYDPGQLIGNQRRYRLGKILGSGGMGQVFLAKDRVLKKQVALKLLHSTLSQDKACKKRFEREVSICRALKSEHIVQIDDVDITTEGYPFFVMERLEGETLAQRLARQECLPITLSVNIIVQVCSGLEIAHQGVSLWHDGNATEPIKVIHRDLKPENIFLVPTASGYLAKILDFGIAKFAQDEQNQYTRLTHTDSFIGTYEFASPEQIRGDFDIDERSDIYSLGMLLYRMLTGADPFGLWRQNRRAVGAWALAHELSSPEPLRSHPHCQVYPEAIESVVMQCLAKSRGERFASVGELRHALQAIPVLDVESALVLVGRPALCKTEVQRQSAVTPTWYPPTVLSEVKGNQKLAVHRRIPIWQMIGAGVGSALLLASAGFALFTFNSTSTRYKEAKTRLPQLTAVQNQSERSAMNLVQGESQVPVPPIAPPSKNKDSTTPQGNIPKNVVPIPTQNPRQLAIAPASQIVPIEGKTKKPTPQKGIAANGITGPSTPIKSKRRAQGSNSQNKVLQVKRPVPKISSPSKAAPQPPVLVLAPPTPRRQPIPMKPPKPPTASGTLPPKMAQVLTGVPSPKAKQQPKPIKAQPPEPETNSPPVPPRLTRKLRQVITTVIINKIERSLEQENERDEKQQPKWRVLREPKHRQYRSKKSDDD